MKFSTAASMPHRNGCGSPTSQVSTVAAIPRQMFTTVDLNILEDVLCHLPRTVIAEHQQHPALNIAMVNQVEDQRDEKDQSFADQGGQHALLAAVNLSSSNIVTIILSPTHLYRAFIPVTLSVGPLYRA